MLILLGGKDIKIDSTFTAGGLAAPVVASVYKGSIKRVSKDEIITIGVPGLMDVYSCSASFITFVCVNDHKQSVDS